MADIELVIRISEEDYLTFSELSKKEKVNELSFYERIIANGTPLPKGHGRIVDENKISSFGWDKLQNHAVVTAPTIIEADKER